MTAQIFVNYRRDDSAASAVAIASHLERAFQSHNVYLDVDNMRAGQVFSRELEKRLASCKVMLCLIGPGWLEARDETGRRRLDDPRDWVRLEIERALARKVVVIPVLVGGAGLPKFDQLPETLRPLVERHAAEITTNGFRNDMAGLIQDIRAVPSRPPWRLVAICAAAVIVGAIALVATGVLPLATLLGKGSAPAANGKRLAISTAAPRLAVAPVTPCDELTAADYDETAKAKPVHFEDIRGSDAVSACRAAVERYPGEPRLAMQLGRALSRTGAVREAFDQFQQAVAAGYAPAVLPLARAYEIGTGVGKDVAKARELLERAAATAANAFALLNLARFHRDGIGVPRDAIKGIEYVRQAVAVKSAAAMNDMGWLTRDGIGVTRDEKAAMGWFQKGAEGGNLWAMRNIGAMHEKGTGVPANCQRAHEWYVKAAISDHTDARKLLAALPASCVEKP